MSNLPSSPKKNNHPRSKDTESFQERRKKADWVINMATALSVVSWFVAFGVWLLLDMAAPEREDFFSRVFGGTVRGYWDTSLLPIAFILLVISFLTCVGAFIFNMMRMRRKTDKYRKSIIIVGIITIVGIVMFLLRFGGLF